MPLARIKPYDKRRGHLLRRYTLLGHRFEADKGWYVVDDALAELLRKARQNPTDDESPLAFDVADTALEGREIEQAPIKRAETPKSGSLDMPLRTSGTTLSTEDLPATKPDEFSKAVSASAGFKRRGAYRRRRVKE